MLLTDRSDDARVAPDPFLLACYAHRDRRPREFALSEVEGSGGPAVSGRSFGVSGSLLNRSERVIEWTTAAY